MDMSLQKKTETNMDTACKQNRQDSDNAPEQRSIFSGNSPFRSEGFAQSSAQLSTPGLDEASRDAETFGDSGEVTFNSLLNLPMSFYNGYYQPAEAAGPPAPHGYQTPEGNSLNRPTRPDSSPIFADTVLSENVRKRFLFTKNQRPRPIPTTGQESSGPSGDTRPTTRNYECGDFVKYGARASFNEDKRLEDTHEEFGTPLHSKSISQFQSLGLSYNSPAGLRSKAAIPSSSSTVPPPLVEPTTSGRRGAISQNPVSVTSDRQAPGLHTLLDRDCGEGSKFLTEPLIPLRSFSPEMLVSRYHLDGPASSPQEHLLSRVPRHPAVTHARGESDEGPAGASPELRSTKRGGNKTASLSLDSRVEEFIERQRANARTRPPYWRTQCHWTIRPLGEAVGSCRYGRACLYGHDGDVYEDNLSVYYTFENGRTCPNFVSQRTLGPSLGDRAPYSPPWVVPDKKPQPQVFHAEQSNRVLENDGDNHLHHSPIHSQVEGDATPTLPPDFPWLHGPQHGMLGHDHLAISTEASVGTDETLFRLEPLVRVEDFLNYYKNKYPALTIEDIIAGMEAQNISSGEYPPDHVQGN